MRSGYDASGSEISKTKKEISQPTCKTDQGWAVYSQAQLSVDWKLKERASVAVWKLQKTSSGKVRRTWRKINAVLLRKSQRAVSWRYDLTVLLWWAKKVLDMVSAVWILYILWWDSLNFFILVPMEITFFYSLFLYSRQLCVLVILYVFLTKLEALFLY